MSNLFSTFDPQSFLGLPFAWMSILIFIFILPGYFWPNLSAPAVVMTSLFTSLKNEFILALGSWSNKSFTLMPIMLLTFLIVINFMGLFPYIFTASSHLSFTLAMALPLWLGHMTMAWINIPQSMLAHLVPLGTPPALMPFMVIIEIISSVIRPLTLSVRLAANMMAGHLLLTLLSQGAPSSNWLGLTIMLSAVILLATLESAVALIQAYVFSVLSTLYLQEVNSVQLSS